jgi:hypothetical protein
MRLNRIDDQLMFVNRLRNPATVMRLKINQYKSVKFLDQTILHRRESRIPVRCATAA